MKEIQQEAYTGPDKVQQKETKQTAAVDLSKRLKDFRSLNDAASLKGEEDCLSPYAHTRVYTQSAICLFHHCSIKYSGSSAMDPIISFSRAMFEEMYHL